MQVPKTTEVVHRMTIWIKKFTHSWRQSRGHWLGVEDFNCRIWRLSLGSIINCLLNGQLIQGISEVNRASKEMRRGRRKLDWTLVMRKELQHWRRRSDRLGSWLKATWGRMTHEESWVAVMGDCHGSSTKSKRVETECQSLMCLVAWRDIGTGR